jgi:SAM-dependent MidA family methyltransferase
LTLLEALRAIITLEGPLSVERYMQLCLGHPVHGYYVTRDPFGAGGDFTTAPEISQMFGEMIGLWAVEVWERLGAPSSARLVELGPGRGTLMADLLRAARIRPPFWKALTVHLVETSPGWKPCSASVCRELFVPVAWHARLDEVPAGPAIVSRTSSVMRCRSGNTWRRSEAGASAWSAWRGGRTRLRPLGAPAAPLAVEAPRGAIVEQSPARAAFISELAARLSRQGGAALLIDYGYEGPAAGDTLQAVRDHAYADPLATPGEADLTAHVDFAALAAAARAAGAATAGPVGQGEFLRGLGIETRAVG